MSWMATAIVGSSLVSAYAGGQAADAASESASKTASSQADAQLKSTIRQIEEMAYQFDYTQEALASGRQIQYNAQNAFATMMGINGPATYKAIAPSQTSYPSLNRQGTVNTEQGPVSAQQYVASGGKFTPEQQRRLQGDVAGSPANFAANRIPDRSTPNNASTQQQSQNLPSRERLDELKAAMDAEQAELDGYNNRMSAGGSTGSKERRKRLQSAIEKARQPYEQELARYESQVQDISGFVDRNNQPQFFGANQDFTPTMGEFGFVDPMADNRQLSGPSLSEDIVYQNVMANQLAPDSYQDDDFFNYAQDSGITGDTFQESPGYQFALDEGMQALENKNSAGGNFGGRAMKEALRYSQGVANQEYYNWAGLRGRDLARTDQAFMDFNNRQGVDVSRMDNATLSYLQRRGSDINRSDQNYQNYLSRLQGTSGVGRDVQATVGAAQSTGARLADTYRMKVMRLPTSTGTRVQMSLLPKQ